MKNLFIIPLFSLATVATSLGAAYATGFNTGYTNNQLAGQNTWKINDSSEDLSFITILNGSIAGALGSYYNVPDAGSAGTTVFLYQDLGAAGTTVPYSDIETSTASFSVDFAVIPSSNDYPSRDTFGFSFTGPGGATDLLTILFQPNPTDSELLDISWTTGGGSPTSTTKAVSYDGLYSLDVDFADGVGQGAGKGAFTATVGNYSFGGNLASNSGEQIHLLGVRMIQDGAVPGDNFISFDNISIVPEPSTGLLALSFLALTQFTRRRKLA